MRLKLALNLSERVGEVLAFARHVASRLDGNAYFPSLPVPLPKLLADIDALEAAEVAARRRTRGAAAERDARRATVVFDLEQEKVYVETGANQHGEDALAVVASSGFDAKKTGAQRKWVFEAEQGERSGEVSLKAPRTNRTASYEWQRSTDGTTWVDLQGTGYAQTVATGLTPSVLYFFRYRTLLRAVLSDWSDPITFRVG